MQRRNMLITGGVALALVLAVAWAFAPRPVEVEVASATQGPFRLTIDEDGKTRLRDRYVVSAPLAGRLQRITLREGDVVKAGDIVATLEPALSPMLDARTSRELNARVDTARSVVDRAAVRIERARVALEQARSELQRSQQLSRQGFVSPTKLETDELNVKAAQREFDLAAQERRVASSELEQARAALTSAQQQPSGPGGARARFSVRSPVSGRVLHVRQASEGTVALGTPLIEVGDVGRLEIVAELLTTDAVRARPGSRVIVERWGGPDLLEGRVRQVEPAAFTKVSALGVEEQRVNVLIDITSPPEQWRVLGDGFRVGVRVVVLETAQAVQVPVSAVFPQVDASRPGAMAVFTYDGGRARLVPVDLGARNGSAAWIKGGVQPGAQVIVYPPTTVHDGARVKARKV